MSGRLPHDPDLEFLRDRELLELAGILRNRRTPEPPLDPAFRSSLRRELRRKHYEMLEPSTSWWRRLTSGPGLAWGGATAGAVAIAVAIVFALRPVAPSSVAVVSSPLDHMRNVAVVEPMKLSFQTAMDQRSVESALQIEPATAVTYSWQGNTLYVQPVAGQLAPNTQYKLTLTTTAKTQGGIALQQPATITFVTAATSPAPTPPSATPSPVVTGVALANPVSLAPAGAVAPVWSPDGSTLYFAGADGSLQSVPHAGGTPASLGVAGVRQIAISADGSHLAVLTATGVYVLKSDGTGAQLFPAPDTLAVAWRQDKAYAALPTGVFEIKAGLDRGHPLTAFAVVPTAAAFSPDGSRLLVVAAGQVHLVDVASGHDTAWPAGATALPAWSQAGSRVAFIGSNGLAVAAPDGTGATSLSALSELGTVAWTDGAVLVAGPSALTGIDLTFKAPVQLAAGDFSAVTGAPSGAAVAYVVDGALWTASLRHPGVGPHLESAAATTLKSFMDARVAGDSDTVNKLLQPGFQAGKNALLFPGNAGTPSLKRWFGVFQQARPDGSVIELVRLVLADRHDLDVQQLDETLTLAANPDGSFAVSDIQQSRARPVDDGPEVIGIEVAAGQVAVTFDSDLKPQSVAGITLGSATATYANRVVTFALDGAQPGDVLTLTIPGSVQDMGGRSAGRPLTVEIVVPES